MALSSVMASNDKSDDDADDEDDDDDEEEEEEDEEDDDKSGITSVIEASTLLFDKSIPATDGGGE